MSNVTRAPEARLDPCRLSPLRCGGVKVCAVALVTLLTASAPSDSWALPEGDLQFVQLGDGFPDTFCVTGGADLIVQTLASGDDRLSFTKPPVVIPVFILSGADGVCDTTKTGNDVQALPRDSGEPNRGIIFSSGPTGDTGICDNVYVALGDDHTLVAAGKSTPRQVGVKAGTDNVLQSVVLGDDVSTAAICPGSDGTLQSGPVSGDDVLSADLRCQQLCGGPSITCVLPGPNETLATTVDAADSRVPYVSTGADGLSQTTAATSDVPAILVGRGLQGTVCVDAGADGIAATSACGNALSDARRVGNQTEREECDDGTANSDDAPNACRTDCTLPFCGDGVTDDEFGEFCDDANAVNGDGCSRQCESNTCGNNTVEPGEQCDGTSPGACPTGACGAGCQCPTPVCGNDVVEVGETCDEGDTLSCDGCSAACRTETGCGDGVVCLPETCDDGGESANCDVDCTPVACGDGVRNEEAGEECDTAAVDSNGPCTSTCKVARCTDGFVCDRAGCTSGPGDGPEECDDGNNSNRDACVADCARATCGDDFVQKVPVSVEDCDPPDENALCAVGSIGAPCDNNADCDVAGINGLCDIACDGNCQDVTGKTCHDGNVDPGEDCDDGNHSNRDDCTNLCRTAQCGDGELHDLGAGGEQCDDGNLVAHDGCNSRCEVECGNGVVDGRCAGGDPALANAGCASNTDCGESSPGSADGNCALDEFCDVGCGSGLVGGLCRAGTVGEGCASNSDCNSPSPGSNDGRCDGDTCGAGCTGLLDGACTDGLVSAKCETNTDCDTDVGLGNGVCVGQGCGPAGLGSLVCVDDGTGTVCSEECDESYCGNRLTECSEECDLGALSLDPPGANGTPGSGCSATCTRTLVGRYETGAAPRTQRECPTAWLYETRGAAVDLENARFVCKDDDPMCDWDTMPDQCTFRIGVCINRPGVGACSANPGGIVAWEVRGLKVVKEGNRHDLAAERITAAVAGLVPVTDPRESVTPGRCVRGLRAKSCNVPNDFECDPTFGSAVGKCDISTGVLFFPPLFAFGRSGCVTGDVGETCMTNADCGQDKEGNDGVCGVGDQNAACTEPISIEVNAGESLKLRAKARRARGPSDTDRLQLSCQKAQP